MKTKKILAFLLIMALAMTCVFALTACKPDTPDPKPPVGDPDDNKDPVETSGYTVTFFDGDAKLDTKTVEKNQKVAKPADPEKDGKVFVGWFATPTMSRNFDFDKAIAADISVFAGFSTYEEDTRDFSIVGSGTSSLLLASKWGTVYTDGMKLAKATDKNQYTITLDLQEGDQFQFALTGITDSWSNQRGFGYLDTTKLPNGDVAFSGAGGLGEASAKKMNITTVASGNYTFTLSTYPADDIYDTENENYTEAGKENFNIGTFDRITFVRNGDVVEEVVSVTDYFIKGSSITEWNSMYNGSTALTVSSDNEKVVTGTFYLKEGEEFLFITRITVGETATDGTEYVRYSNLDTASAELFTKTASYNIVAKAGGDYTFSYNTDTKVLVATLADGEGTAEVADYYLDGTFNADLENWNGYCFTADYKLALNAESGLYEINNVAMAEGEFIIQMFTVGATERGEWGTESYTGLGSRNYTYVNGGAGIVEASQYNNIVVVAEGVYNITYNPYSHIIKITDAKAELVVGMKGTMNGWDPLAEGYVFAENADGKYELTVTLAVGDEFGIIVNPSSDNTWVGRDKLGTSGDAHDAFGTAGNLKATVAGTYKVVYDHETGTYDIYEVTATVTE